MIGENQNVSTPFNINSEIFQLLNHLLHISVLLDWTWHEPRFRNKLQNWNAVVSAKSRYQNLKAFKLSCYKQMLKMPWTAEMTNKWVWNRIDQKLELPLKIMSRKTLYLLHFKYEFIQIIIQGKVESKQM